jgi:PKD repeat protein
LVFSIATISSGIAQQRQVLSGHVPPAVKDLNLPPVARLAATNVLHLAIGLPLRNRAALGALLQQLYDPASPNYRHYLTPAQFAERFGPTPADYQALTDFAKANGLRITGTHPNRAILEVDGSVGDIERALQVTLREYQQPQEARTFYAPDAEPSLDLAVPVLHIAGLDNFSLPHPNLRVGPAAPTGHVVPQGGSEGGEYIGNDFRAAYVPGSPLDGTGQSVALLEYDGYYVNDITHYEALAGLPVVTLTNILINGGPITPGPGDGEVSLDIEMALSMATNLTQILVYEGTNGVTSWATILNQIADDDLANQISCSWSGGAADPSASQVFEQMAAQGQSFFNAAGDSDAFTGAIPFPSDNTNIIIVGGTTLSTTGPGGSYVSETVWNWDVEFGRSENGVGSSGGISTSYSIPPWQQGISMTANQGSTTKRNVPDVALTADHVFVAYGNGLTNWFGGTSCATPLWAAFTALVNQQAAANGLGPVGFLNPALYAIGKGANYTNCFHDITTGNNEWSRSRTKYTAVTGYDLCTGWGTPNGTNLINALSGSAVTSPLLGVSPPSYNFGTLATGTTAQATFTVTNSGGASLSGTATVGLPFAVVTNGSFNLAGFASTNVIVQFAPVTPGTWTSNVVFTSTGGSSTSAVSGMGLTPGSIAVTPARLNFGTLATGTTAQASFVVTNSGGMAVSNGTATVSGGPFTIVSGAVFSMSGLGSTNVVVQFAPVSAGGFTNSVVFATANGGNATNTVSGAGAVAPVASFTAAPTNGIAPLSVTFTDTSMGSITNHFWNFGDGGITNLETNAVVYAYNTAGVYTVTEIVTGPGGSSTNTRPNYIVVLTPFQGWQIQYFGSTNNPNAAPGVDADGTGQNNLFKFVAGLDPTNPASVFLLNIVSDTNQPNAQALQFLPMVGGRTYTPQFNTDLVNGVWLPLATYTGPVINGNQITVTDTNPLPPQEFYRIEISLP